MNIRSIDLQVAIPRTTEASRMQQELNQQTIVQQQALASEAEKTAVQRQQQVQRKPKSEGARVEEKKEHEQQRHNRQDQGTSRQDSEPEAEVKGTDPLRGHHIDIKT